MSALTLKPNLEDSRSTLAEVGLADPGSQIQVTAAFSLMSLNFRNFKALVDVEGSLTLLGGESVRPLGCLLQPLYRVSIPYQPNGEREGGKDEPIALDQAVYINFAGGGDGGSSRCHGTKAPRPTPSIPWCH